MGSLGKVLEFLGFLTPQTLRNIKKHSKNTSFTGTAKPGKVSKTTPKITHLAPHWTPKSGKNPSERSSKNTSKKHCKNTPKMTSKRD